MREVSPGLVPDVTVRDEAGLANRLISVPAADEGLQSQVGLIAMSDLSEPVLLKRSGVNKGLTRQEAQYLQSRLSPYRESLQDAGWRMPKLICSQLARSKSEWQVWSYEQYIPGPSLSSLLRADGARSLALGAVSNVIDTLANYTSVGSNKVTSCGRTLSRLPHGLDLQPSNMVISDTGGTYMVDIFAPKELDADGKLSSYNSKLDPVSPGALAIVCATRQGALLRFLRKTQQEWVVKTESASTDEFIEDVDELLALSVLPADEAEMVVTEMGQGYPFLDTLYRHHPPA